MANLLSQAKSHTDNLTVGVVSDYAPIQYKGVAPVVPLASGAPHKDTSMSLLTSGPPQFVGHSHPARLLVEIAFPRTQLMLVVRVEPLSACMS